MVKGWRGAHQGLQILAITSVQAAVGFPYPVPAWRVFASGGEEDDGVVRLDCKHVRRI